MSDPSVDRASGPERSTALEVWTIVVAGGAGLRFGSRKQFADLGGRTVVQRAVDVAATCSTGVVVVVPKDMVADHGIEVDTNPLVSADRIGPVLGVVAGGASRAESVRAGIAAIPPSCTAILVHDAARPLASAQLFARVVSALEQGADAVVPAIPVSDTIRRRDGGVVDRNELLAVQTPQGFTVNALRRAHHSGDDATDDATLVERAGGTVRVVDGEVTNTKITDPTDIVTATAVLDAASGAAT
jgi:2-C-methyl-D-erythritol 4-phosphate cytidylyltransferase